MRLTGHQTYVAFPCLAIFALSAVLPPMLHASVYVFTWETFVAGAAPGAAYGLLIGACAISLALYAFMFKLTLQDAEVRHLISCFVASS